jgi:hypothetical protein
MKTQKIAGSSVRELKAAALDALVKQELASKHASQASKMTRLKALRLARDAAESPKTNRVARRSPHFSCHQRLVPAHLPSKSSK